MMFKMKYPSILKNIGSLFNSGVNIFKLMLTSRSSKIYFGFILFIILLGIFGPIIAPYETNERIFDDENNLVRNSPPSYEHPLGINNVGNDIFSQILVGARPTVIAGMMGGLIVVTVGLSIGITAGYYGGAVDNLLMRFTDIVYGIPLLPTALVLVGLFGVGYYSSIFIIGMLLWRSSARVLRSQVLQIKERPFIQATKTTGASNIRIVGLHILPNIAPMAVLFFSIGVGYTIIIIASLSFLGVTDPFVPSWGVILRNAYNSGHMLNAWWWSFPPGILISLTVLCTFMFGRNYEKIVSGDMSSDEALV